MRQIYTVIFFGALAFLSSCIEPNQFSFCRDFDTTGCKGLFKEKAIFPLEKSTRTKTIRDFANSIYFRGDRLAFQLLNARSKYDVTFECLHGSYHFGNPSEFKEDLEYIELRDKHVYGLVMLGSLLEKKFAAIKFQKYKPLPAFDVYYALYCHKDLLVSEKISVALK
ncbi:MAG: hypothetical protein LDLANPLL_00334 [Turneriella sp.]|nr:hypothetical protein [Turneriella sp.]